MAKILITAQFVNVIGKSILHEKYDFSKFKNIVDVGGSDGCLLIDILKNTPTYVHGTVFDQPSLMEKAKANIAEHKLSDRCKAIGGNFLESVPVEGDCYFLKDVICDWDDEICVKIFRNIKKSMKNESKILLFEAIDVEQSDLNLITLDYSIWIYSGGKVRNLSEYKNLLEQAGLKFVQLIGVGEFKYSLIEASV
ncbi:hydroxyneurosporene methyltransferase-like protein [Dinothrombium tinctorium]|uniref:Acetylserotonin O-methyltransferase n=1 Tax=Dinothrombium tinctorium TaxID=1965070 RepID=A0A3S3NMN8_9ACAR|nr:hydroxyneurosporene methyltransferase-like protein [Dinothrombium tinctorium]RWS05731.1 hydroxyneurosporene methyltransferase-like protein [Dinothrombium tinctorium]RWS06431.1 hydroxyneurosporene methyltransferase-like protein [Dinothrombium tinctorium]